MDLRKNGILFLNTLYSYIFTYCDLFKLVNESASCRTEYLSIISDMNSTNITSAYEVKNDCCLFERLLKAKKNGVFLLAISFFFVEIFMFLYYANEECDDIIGGSTKTVQHSIKNIFRNIGAVFFKLGTRNVHHKRNIMTPTMLLPWQHSLLQSLSVKNQISPFVWS